ncbi:hypothetical protein O181_014725 [Austropuccinia psidii MF-1]|uniref:Autophagy-related protein 11 n=1 Tax=Austropuccinia psidii MF-1 TaxID=1389203 RepID=A0A9Q3C1H9_9BASI|nr:hypothetical protein [Austropuccinia psidii MF-1]
MLVIRAHDGVSFDFTQQHLESVDCLDALLEALANTIQIEANDIILMNSFGSQLNNNLFNSIFNSLNSSALIQSDSNHHSDSIRFQLHYQNQNQIILHAFDRKLLTADPTETLLKLQSETDDALQAELPDLNLSSIDLFNQQETINLAIDYRQVGSIHLRTTILLLSHVRAQKSSLQVALNNLDKSCESSFGALEAYETFVKPVIQDYGQLLKSFGPSFSLAKKVKIHPHLLSSNQLIKPNFNSSQIAHQSNNLNHSNGPPLRVKFMGDYVMEDRIMQIRDKCHKVYEDFRVRFHRIRTNSSQVHEGAILLRQELNGPDCNLEDLNQLEKDADEGFHRIEQVTIQFTHQPLKEENLETYAELFSELKVLDQDSRERIACLIERKNFWLHHLVEALNKISSLQAITPNIGIEVQALNADLKTRTDSFRHLARLKEFVPAYASTVVEVVRRREFVRHLADYATALSASLSKLTNDERKRRMAYRSEYAGRMPFTVEGLDDTNVPAIEFDVRNIPTTNNLGIKTKEAIKTIQATGVDLPPLTRADIDEMITTLRSIEDAREEDAITEENSPKGSAKEIRQLVEKQLSRLETMENAFALAVERFVMLENDNCPTSPHLESEELIQLRSRVAELEAANQALSDQLRAESTASIAASRKAQQETQVHVRKAEDLKLQLLSVKEESRHEKEKLLQEQQAFIQELDNASLSIKQLTQRINVLEDDLKARSKALQESDRLITSVRATADDATRELHDLEARHRDHLSDHHLVLNQLQQSRDRVTELERSLAQSHKNNQDLTIQLDNKSKLLEDHLSQAEEVRLKMEKEIFNLNTRLQEEKLQSDGLRKKLTQQETDLAYLAQQSQLQAEAHSIAQTRWKEETTQMTSRLEQHCLTAVQALKDYQRVNRTVKERILTMPRPGSSQKSTVVPPNIQQQTSNDITAEIKRAASADSTALKELNLKASFPSPQSAEFEALLQSLLSYEFEYLVDVVQQKLDQLSLSIRKWMKDSKGYRERANRFQEQAQVKITFRDFAKGDLALFLPTRNPTAQVWAAFNVSFPHYFLEATELVAPIIKSREWLVARIISLNEKMVDPKEPGSNPYQLPAGTRYFLLEVEPWSVEKSSRKLAQSMSGAYQTAGRPKMQSETRSVTLPSQMYRKPISPLSKKPAVVESNNVDNDEPSTPQAPLQTEPVATCAIDPLSSTAQSNPVVDLNQSEFTVIDRLASEPIVAEHSSDSPFRTTLTGPTVPARPCPSGLALSLKSNHKSPLEPSSISTSSAPKPDTLPITVIEDDEFKDAPAFKPSESARPAFLASLSLSSSLSRRTLASSAYQSLSKPRVRPVPKAHITALSSSRTESLSSISNLNPMVKGLLKSGTTTPLSKGASTVSTTFASMEKEPSPGQPVIVDSDKPGHSGTQGASQTVRTRRISAIELAKRGVSFSSAMMFGGSSIGGGGSSHNSSSSLSGSGLFIGHSSNAAPKRIEGGTSISRSPSLNVSSNSSHNPNHQIPKPNTTANSGIINNSSNSVLSGSNFFGPWRKRKESLMDDKKRDQQQQQSLLPASSSFIGASELLKRFSS